MLAAAFSDRSLLFPGDRARADGVREKRPTPHHPLLPPSLNSNMGAAIDPWQIRRIEFNLGRLPIVIYSAHDPSRDQNLMYPHPLPPVPFLLHEISPRAIHDHRKSASGNPGCRESISETGKNEQRERERLYHGMVTIGQRVRLLFYRPGRPFSKNIPFSIENERVIMVHEEEEKKRGGI